MKILAEIIERILNRKPRLGRFYLPPKIHKGLVNVPVSMVFSNCWTATERIFSFFDFYIQPFVDCIPHVIKDTKDFPRKWRGLSFFPDTALIRTIDVGGLYAYISHFEESEALRMEMEKGNTKVPVGNLYNLARLILENDYFEFDEKDYRRKLGKEIGTKFSLAFSKNLIDNLEKCFLETCVYGPCVWWRFFDDIFVIWLHGKEKL